MTFFISFVFLSSCAAAAVVLPQLVDKARLDLESSANGPEEPDQPRVVVVQLDPRSLARSGLFRRGLTQRRALSLNSRPPFPSFLSRGRPGPAPVLRAPVSPPHSLRPGRVLAPELKKKGLQRWQKVADKEDKVSLPVSLKESKQTCTAVPFTQVRPPQIQIRSDVSSSLLTPRCCPLPVLLAACHGTRMSTGDGPQQAVLRSVQLPLCPVPGGVCRAESRDRGLPSPGPLLPLRPLQSPHRHGAPAVWSCEPGGASDGGAGVQV